MTPALSRLVAFPISEKLPDFFITALQVSFLKYLSPLLLRTINLAGFDVFCHLACRKTSVLQFEGWLSHSPTLLSTERLTGLKFAQKLSYSTIHMGKSYKRLLSLWVERQKKIITTGKPPSRLSLEQESFWKPRSTEFLQTALVGLSSQPIATSLLATM